MRLEFETFTLQPRHAFHIARAGAPAVRRNVLVRLTDEDGAEGLGEAAANNYYGESAETVSAVLPRLGEALNAAAAGDVLAIERIETALQHAVNRNPAARAALSMALHDLIGRRLGIPVWQLFGLDPATAPLSSFTLGIDTPERMREKLREAKSYPILKLKVGSPNDAEILALVRDEAPHARLRVDANTGWTAQQAISFLPLLAEYEVELLEQPVPAADLDGLRQIRAHAGIPIVADESCVVSEDVPRLAGCVDAVNVKLAKCGSLREAIRIVHVARAHHLGVMLGCMLETTLATAAAVQIAPLFDHADLDGAALLANDPFEGPGLEPDGRLRFNREPGLGVRRLAD